MGALREGPAQRFHLAASHPQHSRLLRHGFTPCIFRVVVATLLGHNGDCLIVGMLCSHVGVAHLHTLSLVMQKRGVLVFVWHVTILAATLWPGAASPPDCGSPR